MEIQNLIADRMQDMSVNAIREILKVVSQPGMVSLAGGIPSPDSFPLDTIKLLCQEVIQKYGSSAFQYGTTEGFEPLRQALADHLNHTKALDIKAAYMFISSGSQGALDAVGKVLISKGDAIGVESPTYLGALQAFDPYEPKYVNLETDDGGLIPEALDMALQKQPLKFVYLVPNFQNPTGRTLSRQRREEIATILIRHDALLIEDDPYGDLRYDGKFIVPIKNLAPDHVIYIGTFSKIFSPGLRVGYYVPPFQLQDWLVIVKQGVDLHTSTFNQALAAEYLLGGHLKKFLPHITALYKPKKDAMLAALDKYFPPEFIWSRPEGGMFLWVEGPAGYDGDALYERAIQNNVAFVPGKYFFADGQSGVETMRLNFTMADETTIDRAIRTLAGVL
jgi:2-aminoadipate transaminase